MNLKTFLSILRKTPLSATAFDRISVAANGRKGFAKRFFMGAYSHKEMPVINDDDCSMCWVWEVGDSKNSHWVLFVYVKRSDGKRQFFFYDPVGYHFIFYKQLHNIFGTRKKYDKKGAKNLLSASITRCYQRGSSETCGHYCLVNAMGFYLKFGIKKKTKKDIEDFKKINSCKTEEDVLYTMCELFNLSTIQRNITKVNRELKKLKKKKSVKNKTL